MMRKITYLFGMLLMTGVVSAQTELLGQTGFDGLEDVVSDCSGGENYTGSVEGRDKAVTGDGLWFRCGGKLTAGNDGAETPNYYAVALDGGSTPLRQLVEGLIPTNVYKVSLKVSKTATNTTRPVTVIFKPFDDTNAASLAGWSEIAPVENVTVNAASVIIGNAAFNSDGFTVFEFYFTTPQANVILQIASAKESGAGSGKDTFIDDVSMKYEAVASTEGLNEFNFSFYPNPMKDELNLNATETMSTIALYNVVGQKVFGSSIHSKNAQVDISSLDKGVYVMKLAIGENSGTYKIVKE